MPDLELLVAGHHGSSGSTSEELLGCAAGPELVLISCGYNSYGHPLPKIPGALARREVLTYLPPTTMGTVSIYVRGDGYAAQSQG